jgi:hypothetical protein
MSYMLGMLMFIAAGALLHDVPWLKFITAMLLISVGTIFMILGRT